MLEFMQDSLKKEMDAKAQQALEILSLKEQLDEKSKLANEIDLAFSQKFNLPVKEPEAAPPSVD
jgi:hypothetical protein